MTPVKERTVSVENKLGFMENSDKRVFRAAALFLRDHCTDFEVTPSRLLLAKFKTDVAPGIWVVLSDVIHGYNIRIEQESDALDSESLKYFRDGGMVHGGEVVFVGTRFSDNGTHSWQVIEPGFMNPYEPLNLLTERGGVILDLYTKLLNAYKRLETKPISSQTR